MSRLITKALKRLLTNGEDSSYITIAKDPYYIQINGGKGQNVIVEGFHDYGQVAFSCPDDGFVLDSQEGGDTDGCEDSQYSDNRHELEHRQTAFFISG